MNYIQKECEIYIFSIFTQKNKRCLGHTEQIIRRAEANSSKQRKPQNSREFKIAKKCTPLRKNKAKLSRKICSAFLRVHAWIASIFGSSGSSRANPLKKTAKLLRFAPENFRIANFERKSSQKNFQPAQVERSDRALASQKGIFFEEVLLEMLFRDVVTHRGSAYPCATCGTSMCGDEASAACIPTQKRRM